MFRIRIGQEVVIVLETHSFFCCASFVSIENFWDSLIGEDAFTPEEPSDPVWDRRLYLIAHGDTSLGVVVDISNTRFTRPSRCCSGWETVARIRTTARTQW